MATLDKVIQMQQQGMTDSDITNQLQNEGVSSTEISDSLNQAKIKNAVAPMDNMNNSQDPNAMAPQPGTDPNMAAPMPQDPNALGAAQQGPEVYPPQDQYAQAPGMTAQDPYAGQQGYDQYSGQAQDPYATGGQQQGYDDYYQQTPQAYSDQGYSQGGGGSASTENVSEIAEQVVTEKLDAYKQKVGDIVSFKNTIQDKVDDIDDRLKRIESNIDKLQQSVVGKIGEFGESSAMIHKDLENLHGTVGKLMNPLIDTYNELKDKKPTHHPTHEKKSS